jgi:hypothetical protein
VTGVRPGISDCADVTDRNGCKENVCRRSISAAITPITRPRSGARDCQAEQVVLGTLQTVSVDVIKDTTGLHAVLRSSKSPDLQG